MEHVFTESMFLVGFVIFIAAILVLDMLVIDRKAHVVSIKEAGSWTAVWIILALAFAVFIYFHGDMVHGIENFDDLKLIASRYASHLKLDPYSYSIGSCSVPLYSLLFTIPRYAPPTTADISYDRYKSALRFTFG